jgi:hypothetical protein
VEKKIRKIMEKYERNINYVIEKLNRKKIESVIESNDENIKKREERDVFLIKNKRIVKLVKRYSKGISGRMK